MPLPSQEYPLNVEGFTGVGANLFNHPSYPVNWMKFSTPNDDNDKSSGGRCAAKYKSGRWYNDCYCINKELSYF